MKAIVYSTTGNSDVLTLTDMPTTDPGAGEVRVRIAVSGVNPTDWKARKGPTDGTVLPAPQVPNQDGAGIVDAVGSGVDGVAVGDRVWIWDAAYQRTEGTAQEFAIIPAHQVVPLPDSVSFDVGASVGIPALTAHRALTSHEGGPEKLAPAALSGTVVLVAGGAGAVGHAAIQLAVWAGATVITTISSDEKARLAHAAGATHTVNYRTEDAAARIAELAPDGVDIVVEVAPDANMQLDTTVLARGGTIAMYTSGPSGSIDIPDRGSMNKNIRYQFILTYTTSAEQKRNAVDAVAAAVAGGALEVGEEHGLPIHRFALAETAAAHDAVEQNIVGKVLIDVASL